MPQAEAPGLKVGSWTLWSIGLVSIVWRFASRRILFGSFAKFQLDDYLMVLCAYVVIQILYLGVWCRPIHNYWAVPVPANTPQCKSYHNHMITVTAFHVSSDLLMLLIPVPMIARTHLPLDRKLILCLVFSLGLLVVILAILNRYFNFTKSNSLVFLIWYNAEASTAVMIANIPYCWNLLCALFSLDAWSSVSKRSRSTATEATLRTTELDRRQHLSLHSMDPTESMERITTRRTGLTGLRELDPAADHDSKTRHEDLELGIGGKYRTAQTTRS